MMKTFSMHSRPEAGRVIRVAAATVLACAAGLAQSLTLDTPSDVEHARIKAEKAWKAWEAQGHIEPKLLTMSPDKAISEIRKDDKLAEQYLSAREMQVKLLSDDFRKRAAALEETAGVPDLSKVQKSEEQALAGLLEADLKNTAELSKIDREPDPGQREAKREAIEKESAYYKQLAEDVKKRIGVLQSSAKSDEQYAENERGLVDTLNRLASTLEEQGAAFAREREDWQSYHKHLEEVVLERNHGAGGGSAKGHKTSDDADDTETVTSSLR